MRNDHDAPSPTAPSPFLPIAAGAFALAVFVIDTATTLDIAIAVLYVVVVLVSADLFGRRGVLVVAAGCLALTVAAYVLSHGLTTGNALLRCFVSLAAISITTLLALRNLSANAVLRNQAQLLDLTHDSVFVRDMDDVITYWNRGAAELYGWDAQQAVGRKSHQLVQTKFSIPFETIMSTLLHTGRWEGELVHTRRDQTPVTVASRWSLQRDARDRPIAILETNTDITERKRADAELRESERRYRHIFQTTSVSIWEEDFSRVKRALDELKASGVGDLEGYLTEHPEFARQAIGLLRVVDVNDATVALLGARRREDALRSLDRVFAPETVEAFARALVALAGGQTSYSSETVIRTLRGDTIAVLFTVTRPAESTGWESILISLIDVTARNRAQEALQQAQAELAHVARVTTLGELTASIAHEVNQPLAAMVTNGEACLRWLGHDKPDMDEVRGAIDRIIRDGKRASDVIWRIRSLSQKAGSEKAPVSLNEVINDVLPLLQREVLSHRVSLRLNLAPGLPNVLGDRIQLQQVVVNLLMNGIQAMASVNDRPRELSIWTDRHEGDRVLVGVRDTGVGIGISDPTKLFDAFYTTRPNGMGMGLSICRSIIEAHGGRVWAARESGPGATFQFALPSIQDDDA
jgi:PAS domain S-box-containing protein